MKIFILTGQSNSLGTTGDPEESDITPGKDPLDGKIPFFWANRSTRAGDGVAVLYDDSGGKILTLRAQKGEGVNPLFWGPEISFGRTLASRGENNFMIVKASRGGGGNSYWLKGNSDDHMYRHVVDIVKDAIKALKKKSSNSSTSMSYEIAALLYVQGESDSAAEAAESGERLQKLAENLRKDLPHAKGMKVVIGGIAAAGKERDVVRSQQSALPAMYPTFKYIDTLDLRSQLMSDGLHFNKQAKLAVGQRMAKAWLEWQKGKIKK